MIGAGNVGCAVAHARQRTGHCARQPHQQDGGSIACNIGERIRRIGDRDQHCFRSGAHNLRDNAGIVLIASGVNQKKGATNRDDPQGRLRLRVNESTS
jgi:hypothetical protein